MSRRAGPQTRLARIAGLAPGQAATAARTPFVLLVVVLLGAGMLALLILNASLNQGSFELSELRRETQELTDEQQRLQAEVDGHSAPGALAERAEELGLVPAGPPAFLGPDGTVLGDDSPAPAPEPEEPEEPAGEGEEGAEQPAEPADELPREPIAPQAESADQPLAPAPPAEQPAPEAPAADPDPDPDDDAPAPVEPTPGATSPADAPATAPAEGQTP
ncbi:septum formation initiator family protein [Streptomyces profundus]|uniref:septum formation initiator family protein n=1 Tax=Streptomyces profundus TaxID=2867410 RepID=UPI001D161177|nr:septum formation initiator family protein [Streptomyces sp. MA3_2.13]UED83685.1 septum formation initiator family protein [Streptomyces sp. MA3_2.13]